MRTPTKKVGMGPKNSCPTNNHKLTKVDRDIVLGDIEIFAEAEGYPLEPYEYIESQFDKMLEQSTAFI
jgi:hypothetical protein